MNIAVDPDARKEFYRIWQGMISRCLNDRRYAERGIKVCDRWQDFDNFFTDMHPRPAGKYSIDRIDNSGDYSPVNCRWATPAQQSNNRRGNRLVEIDGVVKTMAQWCGGSGSTAYNAAVYYAKKIGIGRRLRKCWRRINTRHPTLTMGYMDQQSVTRYQKSRGALPRAPRTKNATR